MGRKKKNRKAKMRIKKVKHWLPMAKLIIWISKNSLSLEELTDKKAKSLIKNKNEIGLAEYIRDIESTVRINKLIKDLKNEK